MPNRIRWNTATITRLASQALADETDAAQRDVEHKQRVDRNADAVPHNARAAHDTDPRCQGPCDQDEIDWYADQHRHNAGCTECRSDDEGKEGVAYDGDGLEEGSVVAVSSCSCFVDPELTCYPPAA
jgi:hypothetical protein